MKKLFFFALIGSLLWVSCNNQPAKRQNAEDGTMPNSSNTVMSDYQEQENTPSSEDVLVVDEPVADVEEKMPERIDFEKSASLDQVERAPMSAEELQKKRDAAIERRRAREEAQRARAIARAEQTGDQATIRQEENRPSTAAIQVKNQEKKKKDHLSQATKEKIQYLQNKNKATMDDKAARNGGSIIEERIPAEAQLPVVDHSDWDYLLRQYVSKTGKVDYKGLKTQTKALDKYLKQLKNYPPAKAWSRGDKMAYWINAYNAFTVKLILDNYPVNSITSLDGGKPWDKAWIKLGDENYTLNNIENSILRPIYKDARIHFAVNCAAKSCPPLLNRAWTADNLERYFEIQTRSFINNSTYNSISANKVEVSKIFEWYAEDFDSLIEFLNKYSDVQISPNAQVSYREYDWALNE